MATWISFTTVREGEPLLLNLDEASYIEKTVTQTGEEAVNIDGFVVRATVQGLALIIGAVIYA